jgi:hypothetical protein
MTTDLNHKASRCARMLRPASLAVLAPLLAIAGGCTKPHRAHDHISLTSDAPGERLLVKNHVGDVRIIADPSATTIRAEITRVGRGTSPAEAQRAREEITVDLAASKDEPGAVLARARHPHSGHTRDYEVDWRITAPPNIAVRVVCDIGDVTVKSIARPVEIKTDIGDTHVYDARAGLIVTVDVGDIHASAAGVIRLRSDVGDVRLRVLPDAAGAVTASSDVGDIVADLPVSRRGLLSATTGVGDVRIRLENVLMNKYHQRNNFVTAELGGDAEPPIEFSSDVGDVVIRTYNPTENPSPK